ncbi:hypothetical protein EDB85DRAFT_1390682 [Lactarius pseudohatsudake]|nr:hypothetical protein EDB85DRAFT_1390682 [Lactarius pseudohatsudake]
MDKDVHELMSCSGSKQERVAIMVSDWVRKYGRAKAVSVKELKRVGGDPRKGHCAGRLGLTRSHPVRSVERKTKKRGMPEKRKVPMSSGWGPSRFSPSTGESCRPELVSCDVNAPNRGTDSQCLHRSTSRYQHHSVATGSNRQPHYIEDQISTPRQPTPTARRHVQWLEIPSGEPDSVARSATRAFLNSQWIRNRSFLYSIQFRDVIAGRARNRLCREFVSPWRESRVGGEGTVTGNVGNGYLMARYGSQARLWLCGARRGRMERGKHKGGYSSRDADDG